VRLTGPYVPERVVVRDLLTPAAVCAWLDVPDSTLRGSAEVSAQGVADWMLKTFEQQDGVLYQEEAAADIERLFGGDSTYLNDAGNLAISKDVLDAFRKLTKDAVVWEAGEKCWRRREQGDDPGRRQQ
jgi:hypothetical protein